MIRLTNTTSDLISLITAQNGAKVFACYNDRTATSYGPGANQPTTISSATTTTIVSTPAASTVREVDFINIKNTFAGAHTMTVQASISGTLYPLKTFTLLQDESFEYTHSEGWKAFDASGNIKESLAATTNWSITGDLSVGGDIYSVAWNDYSASSTIVGWSAFTTKQIYYKKVGKLVFVTFDINGTSNATGVTFTLPITAASAPTAFGGCMTLATDNAINKTTATRVYISASGSTVTCDTDMSAGLWTNSGTKRVLGSFWYQAA